MTPIFVPREALKAATTWEVNGQSPSISPQAIMQQAQQLLGVAGNPIMGPASGLQVHALTSAIIANGAMRNLKGVQLTENEVAQRNAPTPNPAAPALGGPASGPMGDPNGGGGAGVPGGPAPQGGIHPAIPALLGLLAHLHATGQAGGAGTPAR